MPELTTFLNRQGGVNDHQRPKPPETEVTPRAKRRRFTAAYKLRILAEADQCSKPGEVGALLRREGLYSSNLSRWRRQRDEGQLQGLTPKKRGPKKAEQDEMAQELERLRREKAQLEERLEKAETIIEVQKKLSTLLGVMPPESTSSDER
jgi:transposase-like protein